MKPEKENPEVKACPKCRTIPSTKDFERTQRGSSSSFFKCRSCGYRGLPIQISMDELTSLNAILGVRNQLPLP